MFLVDLRVRYILPIVPPMVILFTYGVFNVYLRIKQPAYLFAVLALVSLPSTAYYLWRYFQDVAPLGLRDRAGEPNGLLGSRAT